MSAYTDKQLLSINPYDGADRDVKIRCRTVKLVTLKKAQPCPGPWGIPHKIKAGERARVERAIVDGDWGAYYVCIPCMEACLKEDGIKPLVESPSGVGERP